MVHVSFKAEPSSTDFLGCKSAYMNKLRIQKPHTFIEI
jgi:hypothetical protein